MAPHLPKPHKPKHKMDPNWALSSAELAANIPGAAAGDDNDGVQRMFDYIADAPQTPENRAYAAADAFADSSAHFAALARSTNAGADEVAQMAQLILVKTLSHFSDVIVPSIKNGHKHKG